MNAHDAAEKIRPTFHLESMPPEDRRRSLFVEQVAAELGVEASAFNLHQVSQALAKADLHPDDNEYPKMLFSRQHHAVEGIAASVYDPRHDHVYVNVNSEQQAAKLGNGWIEDHHALPPRGDTPVDAIRHAD